MPRHKRMVEREDGWCDWVSPEMAGYRMACCDCGLVHDMEFVVARVEYNEDGSFNVLEEDIPGMKVLFRARRNNRSTAQVRRHKPNAPLDQIQGTRG